MLFAAVFWPNLRRLWWKTNPFTGEANWGHAIVVPAIGLYYLFIHREELAKAKGDQFVWGSIARPGRLYASLGLIAVGGMAFLASHGHVGTMFSLIGAAGYAIGALGTVALLLDWSIGTTLYGIAVYVYGIYPGQNDYIKDVGMIITLFGIVLMIYGWAVMRIAWFPIVFLICAIPWPGLVYSWVAEPLQQMAADVAVIVLKSTGVEAISNGTKIIIYNADLLKPPRVLNVAEACAGMRSLMTFITVGGAVAFLVPRRLWQRIIIVVSAIPIAIGCNVLRISGQGLLDHYVSQEWSESFAHQFVGMVMLLPAFFLILGVAWALDKLYIEEAEEITPVPTTARAAAKPQVTPISPVAQSAPRSVPGSGPAKAPATARPATVTPPVTTPRASAVVPQRPRSIGPVQPRAIVPPRPVRGPIPPKQEPS